MRIGLFGGSFDPVHLSHLQVADKMRVEHQLDEVWFCPVRRNPLKPHATFVSEEGRKVMLEKALKGFPYFKLYLGEYDRPPPSYTVDTLKILTKERPSDQFFLIMGEDAFEQFSLWKEYQLIEKLATILVAKRTDLSSTKLRERLKKGLNCDKFIPREVLDYIHSHGLYSDKTVEKRDMSQEFHPALLNYCAQVLYDKKAMNILALDVRNISTLVDVFIIAEGGVERHVQALSLAIQEALQKFGIHPLFIEGEETGDWIVLNYSGLLIHLFTPEMRDKYAIEKVWKEGKIVDLSIQIDKRESYG